MGRQEVSGKEDHKPPTTVNEANAQYKHVQEELANGQFRAAMPEINELIDWTKANRTGVTRDRNLANLHFFLGKAEYMPDASDPTSAGKTGGSSAADNDFVEALKLFKSLNTKELTEAQARSLPYVEINVKRDEADNLEILGTNAKDKNLSRAYWKEAHNILVTAMREANKLDYSNPELQALNITDRADIYADLGTTELAFHNMKRAREDLDKGIAIEHKELEQAGTPEARKIAEEKTLFLLLSKYLATYSKEYNSKGVDLSDPKQLDKIARDPKVKGYIDELIQLRKEGFDIK